MAAAPARPRPDAATGEVGCEPARARATPPLQGVDSDTMSMSGDTGRIAGQITVRMCYAVSYAGRLTYRIIAVGSEPAAAAAAAVAATVDSAAIVKQYH